MPPEGSVSHWIAEIKRGNPAAAEVIWDRYFPQLVRLAQKKLHGLPGRMADEEDVALSALESFCRGAQRGRFPDLADRQGLWRLLFQMTAHKVADLARHETRQVRGGGRVQSESALDGSASRSGDQGLGQIAGDAVSPEFAAMMADQCRRLLGRLEPDLQRLALAKMEGYSNEEIAQRTGRSLRTVERRLHLIRTKWEEEPAP
jgi:DNA-directed RNA polymerase specialized sigma24 family protein